jgi:hypothetical protein
MSILEKEDIMKKVNKGKFPVYQSLIPASGNAWRLLKFTHDADRVNFYFKSKEIRKNVFLINKIKKGELLHLAAIKNFAEFSRKQFSIGSDQLNPKYKLTYLFNLKNVVTPDSVDII